MEVWTGQADPEHAPHQRITSADQPDHHLDYHDGRLLQKWALVSDMIFWVSYQSFAEIPRNQGYSNFL